jgi:hypothetical protein
MGRTRTARILIRRRIPYRLPDGARGKTRAMPQNGRRTPGPQCAQIHRLWPVFARILIRRGFLSDMAWPESSQLSELARAVPNVVCLPGLRCQKRPYVERDSALRIQKSVGRKSLRMGGLSCLLAPNLSPPLFLAYVPGVAQLPARTSTPGRSLLSLFGCLL